MGLSPAVSLLLTLLTADCARYRPQPVDLAAFPTAYRERRLDDSGIEGPMAIVAALRTVRAGHR